MFLSAFLVAASLISLPTSNAQAAEKRPSQSLVESEALHPGYFRVILDGVVASQDHAPSSKSRINGDDLLEWTSDSGVKAATYGNARLEDEKNVWRLTELNLSNGEMNAATTTFFKDGLRSRTECSGKTSSTLQCATASYNLCGYFKKYMDDDGAKLGFVHDRGGEISSSVKKQMIDLGQQCAEYATFLHTLLDPNKAVTDGARGTRDSELVEKDLQAIDSVIKAGKSKALKQASFKGLNDLYDKGDDVGASSTGMKNRATRLQEIAADFKVMSKLALTCADSKFTEEFQGSNLQIKSRPKLKSTRK